MNFEPLHIRAHLQTPVISDIFLPLDGVIFNQFIRDVFGPKDFTKPRESMVSEYSEKSLPIQKRNIKEHDWYYACSFAIWPETMAHDRHEYAKRFDTHDSVNYVDFEGKRGKVYTNRGEFKNYFVKEYTISSPYVDWYCRGVRSDIETLLAFCTHVGKKSAQGCGSVLKWEVNQTERDWYRNDNAGRLTRAIPAKDGKVLYGIRPSYWLPKHQFYCMMPG